MKRQNLVFVVAAIAFIAAMAGVGGCDSKVNQCTKDSDCPLGACDLTVNRCALVSCAGGSTCPVGTYCSSSGGSLCLTIPDGGTNDCSPACAVAQICLATRCENIYAGVAITQPTDGTAVTGVTNVVAQLNPRPGFPRRDPSSLTLLVSLDGGTPATSGQLQIQDAGLYQGPYIPTEDGPHQLTARYDAANLISNAVRVSVSGFTCTPACPSYQQCVSSQCQARYSGISITQPPNGVFLDGGTPVLAQLIPNAGFQPQDPSTLDLMIGLPSGGTGSGTLNVVSPVNCGPGTTSGCYQGSLAPTGDGLYQLIAQYLAAGLSSPAVRFTILTTPPAFTLTVPTPPTCPPGVNCTDPGIGALAWRRDQVLLLSISSTNANLVPGSVSLTVTGIGPRSTSPPVVLGSGCGFPYCATAQVDLSQPDMNAFRGAFGLSVVGTDRAGNTGRTDGGVTLTRWKWEFTTPDGLPIRTSPAIGSNGTVYVGTGNLTNSGTAYAINPDGTLKWSRGVGSMVASPAVGDLDGGVEPVYVATNDATGTTIRAFNGMDGGDWGGPTCPVPTGTTRASLAVTKIGGGEACFAAVNSATGGVMMAYRPLPLPGLCISGGTVVPGGPLVEPAAVAVDTFNNAYFALQSLRVQSVLFDGGWQPRPNWPVDAGANSAALAIANGVIVGAATNTDGGFGGVFTYNNGGQLLRIVDGGVAWNPSATTGSIVLYGQENPARLTSASTSTGTFSETTGAGLSRGAPAIGSDGTIYVADALSNTIFARDPLLGPKWTGDSLGGGTFSSSIALDCSRDGGAPIPGRPGVLYVPDIQQNLFCIITDGRGIDPLSFWPKYQHDPRNTGNEQTLRMQFSCP